MVKRLGWASPRFWRNEAKFCWSSGMMQDWRCERNHCLASNVNPRRLSPVMSLVERGFSSIAVVGVLRMHGRNPLYWRTKTRETGDSPGAVRY